MHGYEIMTELEMRTSGVWKPSPGSVYPTLALLQDEGLVEAATEGTRKTFSLTDAGRTAAPDPASTPPWASLVGATDPAIGDLKTALRSVRVAVEQVIDAGNSADRVQATDLLVALRRELYLILAGEKAPDQASDAPAEAQPAAPETA